MTFLLLSILTVICSYGLWVNWYGYRELEEYAAKNTALLFFVACIFLLVSNLCLFIYAFATKGAVSLAATNYYCIIASVLMAVEIIVVGVCSDFFNFNRIMNEFKVWQIKRRGWYELSPGVNSKRIRIKHNELEDYPREIKDEFIYFHYNGVDSKSRTNPTTYKETREYYKEFLVWVFKNSDVEIKQFPGATYASTEPIKITEAMQEGILAILKQHAIPIEEDKTEDVVMGMIEKKLGLQIEHNSEAAEAANA
jgi:hypothetical protein